MQYLSSALRCSVGNGWEPNCITVMELNQRIPKGICVPSPAPREPVCTFMDL